ncbi:MAG: 3-keto-disaccharide hydrolase [Opitutaceae bacterium]
MNSSRKHYFTQIITYFLVLPCLIFANGSQEGAEPEVRGADVIELIKENSFEGWKVPSERWSIQDGVIVGDTEGQSLTTPEWLYTKQRFADFIFTCEVKLTGSRKPNSGLYFRVNPFEFKWRNKEPYEAASGYEFDVVLGKHNASLGDWYARPKLRIFANKEIIDRAFKENDWNRMTIRARGKHIEYWLNGAKVVDYVDEDPKASSEGIIGLQIHDNAVMKVELRKARVLSIDSK